MSMTRRETLAMAAGSVVVASFGNALAGGKPGGKLAPPPPTITPLGAGKHAPVPLPFDPRKLPGLSEPLLSSHHGNNYGGAVKNLNKVELELENVTKDTPGYLVAALRERELTYTNSMILHERYFGNLGGDGKASGAIAKALDTMFGSAARWEELFRATAMSLGGGSGWVILDLNFHSGDLRIYGSGGHAQSVASGAPLLVLDMFEHAYALDYGAAHAKYVDAFFANVRWSEVDRRFQNAAKAARALAT
jgi:Fe-Mn family superoxide dismutase